MPAASPVEPFAPISGVLRVPMRTFRDSRGAFTETFRREWFPDVDWTRLQANCSVSKAGVLRGLHYHLHQIDYWFVVSGRIEVGMADLRASSPSFGRAATIILSGDEPCGLFIPVGVAHGFHALTDVTLTYLVNNYYDGADERGVAWNDPTLAVPWSASAPVLSERDAANPRFSALLPEHLPR